MNESDTRLHKIDPQLKAAGWGVKDGSRITTEYTFTKGKISQTQKGMPKRADYVLVYKGVKLAIVEAKSDELSYAEGVDQAKQYADMLSIRFTYATNGNQIWEMDRKTMEEHFIAAYPSPEELWARTYGDVDEWRDRFNAQPYYDNGVKQPVMFFLCHISPFFRSNSAICTALVAAPLRMLSLTHQKLRP